MGAELVISESQADSGTLVSPMATFLDSLNPVNYDLTMLKLQVLDIRVLKGINRFIEDLLANQRYSTDSDDDSIETTSTRSFRPACSRMGMNVIYASHQDEPLSLFYASGQITFTAGQAFSTELLVPAVHLKGIGNFLLKFLFELQSADHDAEGDADVEPKVWGMSLPAKLLTRLRMEQHSQHPRAQLAAGAACATSRSLRYSAECEGFDVEAQRVLVLVHALVFLLVLCNVFAEVRVIVVIVCLDTLFEPQTRIQAMSAHVFSSKSILVRIWIQYR